MISAIITNYNHGQFTIDAYKSLLKQTLQPDEILIVDDQSTDDSVQIIQNYLESSSPKIPTRLLTRSVNGGSAAARNTGLSEISEDSQFVCLLDGDDLYYKNKIERSYEIIRKYNRISMVYSDFDSWDFKNNKVIREWKPSYSAALLKQTCIANTNSMFRKSILDKVGGFNEEIRGGEDYDMWIRLASCSLLYHIPEALFAYRMHGENMTVQNRDQVIQNTQNILQGTNNATK